MAASPDQSDSSESVLSTREMLLSVVDDMELICRELIEKLIAPKAQRLNAQEQEDLTNLLLEKDDELKKLLKVAAEQGEVEKTIHTVEEQVRAQDDAIKQLQKQFKEAESMLATSIYHARQKLSGIEKAKEMPVPSEELIRYAHRISASNAVCAPLNWQQGDPRRPYPNDMEMRLGLMSRPDIGDRSMLAQAMPPSSHGPAGGGLATPTRPGAAMHLMPQHPSHLSPFHVQSPSKMHSVPQGGQFSWQGGEMSMMMRDGSYVPIEGRAGPQQGHHSQQQAAEDVDVMSTDSSSSSSTDSN